MGVQIVWERCASDKERIHCDERSAVALEFEHCTLYGDKLYHFALGSLDYDDVLRYD